MSIREKEEDGYYDLGSFSRPITTRSAEAQKWFDRGLVWSYAFNHEESAKCFERAIAHDTGCAMAYWGLAYALGPNYNKPWDAFDDEERDRTTRQTHEAVRLAREHASDATPVERELIDAESAETVLQAGDRLSLSNSEISGYGAVSQEPRGIIISFHLCL